MQQCCPVAITLDSAGVSCWYAQQELNLGPTDYEAVERAAFLCCKSKNLKSLERFLEAERAPRQKNGGQSQRVQCSYFLPTSIIFSLALKYSNIQMYLTQK